MDMRQNEWFIEVPWGRLCVLVWGNCTDPPVLLVHGNDDNAISFMPLIRHLPKKFYFVAIELPGMGRSDRMHPGLMITMYDLMHVIDHVACHFRWDSFDYIGHGLGAVLGKLYNYSVPQKISKLVEIDPINFISVEPDDFAHWYTRYYANFYNDYQARNANPDAGKRLMRKQAIAEVVSSRGVCKEIASRLVDRSTRPSGDGYVKVTTDQRLSVVPSPAFTADYMRNILLKLPTPTLHIVSSESVKLGKFGNTTFLQQPDNYLNNNLRYVQLEGSHYIHLQKPELVANYIGSFLLGGNVALDLKSKL